MTIGIAIPAYVGYINYLEELLENISKQTILPDIVVVSISEVDTYTPKKDYGLNLKIITHKDKQNASQNRNTAARELDTDIISFFDCDDLMHPQRTEFILGAFDNDEVLALVHNFEISKQFSWKKKEFKTVNEFLGMEHEEIKLYPNSIHVLSKKKLFPRNEGISKYSYHNAHVSIRKELFEDIQYNIKHPFPDSLFNRRLVEGGYKLSYLKNMLSYYNLK